ncbi:hypothetical protein EYF80_063291 [Liparis tanakae]|uniref:Uncharacterized protein n=1 Tax=Liparis tanakae TaxID=230148 RepID=A0A4Z2ECX6_9TELE|nr:hypothetical protein EYF80_063291 [Liparis tanakae]
MRKSHVCFWTIVLPVPNGATGDRPLPLIAPHVRTDTGASLRSPGTRLTSPAVVVALLAVDAALGVGDRCRVTSAMAGGCGAASWSG